MRIVDSLIAEIEQEAATTRRVLERVPEDKLEWRPHPKSMSLGQLALHVAQTTGQVVDALAMDVMEAPEFGSPPSAESSAQLLSAHDASVAHAIETLNGWDDARAVSDWSLTKDGETLMVIPRIGFMRGVGMNHLYHHRGQLSVYLRLLDVPVPSIYGPSADENPFG